MVTSSGTMADPHSADGSSGPWVARVARARKTLLCLASPTWAVADRLKRRRDEVDTTALIVRLNHIYLGAAVVAALLAFVLNGNTLSGAYPLRTDALRALWFGFLWSRCTEVFAAFYRDAFDKLNLTRPGSCLSPSRRVRLALNSYAELILNFALLYWLFPPSVWKDGDAPSSFTDILFYSASTITTSGGGGFIPGRWPLQLLTAYEIACGLILLVVCFAIYAGEALSERRTEAQSGADVLDGPTMSPADGSA